MQARVTNRLKCLAVLMGLAMLLSQYPARADLVAEGERLMREVRIGGIRLGQPQGSLPAQAGCKLVKAQELRWEADGLYHQDWSYSGCGLVLNLASAKAKGPKTV